LVNARAPRLRTKSAVRLSCTGRSSIADLFPCVRPNR
jgi:hypothetical protein